MFVLHVTALLPLDVIEDNDDIKYYGKKFTSLQRLLSFKDDIRQITDLKQQISQKMILGYLCRTSP